LASLHIFTSAAMNYLPKVRALCRSIKQFHPEAVVHLALADLKPEGFPGPGEPFDSVLPIDALDIPDWRGWSFMHDVVELSTAIKPFALAKLLDEPGCEKVLYFDPDMVLFSRVDDLIEGLATSNVAITPHQNKPETTLDAVMDNEVTSLRMGVFNLGFIGVANTDEGRRFTGWWADRVYYFCRGDVRLGIFTDQKWINFAPVFFDGVWIVKSSRHNVATWNLTTRRFTGSRAEGYRVDGEPLGFYHFTGFDSGAHRVMAMKNATGNRAVQELIEWYEHETQAGSKGPKWAFSTFDDGTPIRTQHRLIYRDRKDLQAAFPDPYLTDTGTLTFLEWCDTEGRIRYPEFFASDASATPLSLPGGMTVPPGAAWRMFLLLFAPRAGRLLRSRLIALVRREGLGGIARRLRSPAQAGLR